ncbi:MAG: hypothetical protein DFNUSKGM_000044 [Candidatus Fervidibacter sacchari]
MTVAHKGRRYKEPSLSPTNLPLAAPSNFPSLERHPKLLFSPLSRGVQVSAYVCGTFGDFGKT